jgi:hypothetical protein
LLTQSRDIFSCGKSIENGEIDMRWDIGLVGWNCLVSFRIGQSRSNTLGWFTQSLSNKRNTS